MRLSSLLAVAVVVSAGALASACQQTQPPPTAAPVPTLEGPVTGGPDGGMRPGNDPPTVPTVLAPLRMASLIDPPTMADPPPIVELRQRIAGREGERATAVFQNVTTLTSFTASELLTTMTGFNEALGVRCTFCHTAGRWEADLSDHKEIAHGMIRLTHQINAVELARSEADAGSRVTCFTCHRGRTRPQLSPADTSRRRPSTPPGTPPPAPGAPGGGRS